VVLPDEIVSNLGWKEGIELDLDTKKAAIILRAKDSNN
jgi:bifunctional DNA-binding transcriptional regulator/antitoxin component of YhaV-PrlF toxin-antitoxin module